MVPALGFGTAPMLGRINNRQSLRALELAYASGIRHFDTARSYGWGECEGLLGDFLQQYPRDAFTLVSKCGLVPAPRSSFLSVAKKLGRQVVRAIPASRTLVRRVAATVAPSETYDVATLRASVETSLRELRTPYLDVLLLHNFEAGKAGFADVLALFRELRRDGKVRRFGVSLHGELVPGLEYLRAHGALSELVVQVPVSDQLLSLAAPWAGVTFFAHSPFKYLQTHRSLDEDGLATLLDELAEKVHCEALVCSMFSASHLRRNIALHARHVSQGLHTP